MTVSPATRRSLIVLSGIALLAAAVIYKGPRLLQLYYHHGLRLVPVATGLDTPWSLAFLPDGQMLVTERSGHLRLLAGDSHGGRGREISGLPPVWLNGGAGLLSVTIDPQFPANHLIYWSYVAPAPDGKAGSVAVARGRLEDATLQDVQVILRDPEVVDTPAGFGSRLLFTQDGKLLVTLGDRDHRDDAQRLDSLHGKILRIEADGRIPADNPFVGKPGANPAIWALGFRDPQGLAIEPSVGRLWASDHGPLGGDEINLILPGHNYGWPVVTYGVQEGTGAKIGEGTEKAGMDPPALWSGPDQGMPPTGMTFLTSDRYREWRGQLFVGTLWGQAMLRIGIAGTRAIDLQHIFTGRFQRVRDVQQGPDGWLYIVANEPDGAVIRLER
ncbi:MAG TPA: PQQ-dependent sugar dehydrogenase [Steroidobacteraceae bacterium]|nr:PQQ-dependent sugar dehydrogenase [Steroidobacteraceae bacterium]